MTVTKLKLQLINRLRLEIENGLWAPGDKLPSLRQAAAEWGCSLPLANKVYAHLAREGRIVSRDRSGYWVSSGFAQLKPIESWTPITPVHEESTSRLYHMLQQMGSLPTELSFAYNTAPPAWLPLRTLRQLFLDLLETSPTIWSAFYTDLGDAPLRQALAALALQEGWTLDPNELLITGQGGTSALQFCLKAVTQPGDRVLVESPFSPDFRELLWSLRLVPIEVPIHETRGLSAAAFERMLKHYRPAASILQPILHYPTGAIAPEAEREAIAQISGKQDHPVIEISSLPQLTFGKSPTPIKAFERRNRNILWCADSNYLGNALNLGWCAPGRYRDQVIRHKLAEARLPSTLHQRVTANFLSSDSFKRYVNQLRKTLAFTADQHVAEMLRSFPPGTVLNRPRGGFANWLRLPGTLTGQAVHEAAAASGILVIPGNLYEMDTTRFSRHLLIHHSDPLDEHRRDALHRLGALMHELLDQVES